MAVGTCISWEPFQTHSPISGPLNPQQVGSWNLVPRAAGRASSASAGNPFKLTLPFRASEPTAGWQLEPVIGRVPRAAGRASSASAGNPFKLTLPFPVLRTHSRVAVGTCYWTGSTRRRASIISISWKPFQTHSPISGPLNPQQGGSWNLLLDGFHTRSASIISISWEPFQTHSPISGPLNPQQAGSWNLLLDGFHAPQGEHHQNQLETLSNSLF